MGFVERLERWRTTPSARHAPHAWAFLFDAYRRGDHDAVLRDAGPAFAELSSRPGGEEWVAGPPLLAGAVLAARELLAPAAEALRDGLVRLPGTAVAAQLGDGDWHALQLAEVLVLQGRVGEAGAWVDHLLGGAPPLEVRLGATRAAAHLRIASGDLEGAHHLCNAAADLAERTRSNLAATLVETDRAVLAAAGGSHATAARTTLEAAERLLAGGRAPHWLLAASQAGLAGTAAARASADAGDPISAAATAEVARAAVAITGRRVDHVRALLATAAAARAQGDVATAEDASIAAAAEAADLGAEPLAALALVEQAALAGALGLRATEGPLAARALDQLSHLGLALEADRLARRRATPGPTGPTGIGQPGGRLG